MGDTYVLFGMQNKTVSPYLAAIHKVLISVMNEWHAKGPSVDKISMQVVQRLGGGGVCWWSDG
jgi:hypothetical protein